MTFVEFESLARSGQEVIFPFKGVTGREAALNLSYAKLSRFMASPQVDLKRSFDQSPFATLPNRDLDILIPPYVLESVDDHQRLGVIRLDEWVDQRMDQEYKPSFHMLIIEKDGLNESGDSQERVEMPFGKSINHWRRVAIERNLMAQEDKVLIQLIAHDGFGVRSETVRDPLFSSTRYYFEGLQIVNLAVAESNQRQGFGNAFYDRLEDVAAESGYKYIFGLNNATSIGFFLQRDRYKTDQLIDGWEAERLMPGNYKRSGVATIKFLDRILEEACVKPEFLK